MFPFFKQTNTFYFLKLIIEYRTLNYKLICQRMTYFHHFVVLLIGRPEAAEKSGQPIGRAGPLRKFLRLTLYDLFLPFLSIFSTFYRPSGHFRPNNGHFYRILALFTTLRVVIDLILAIYRFLALLTTGRVILDLF